MTETQSARPSIFISYSREDKLVADRLAADLAEQDIDVWYDARLRPGEDWRSEILKNLRSATAVVALVSPASIQSDSVQQELAHAVGASSRVIPVRVAWTGSYVEPPADISKFQWINLNDDYEAAVALIASIATKLTNSAEPPPAASIDISKIADEIAEKVYLRLGIDPAWTEQPASTSDNQDKTLVFVITSFDPAMEPSFEAISAAAKRFSLRAERVKDVPGDYRITEKMLEMLRSARFIVADLTLERPNVYFELGYARGIGQDVITIVRKDAKVHFDVYDWTHIEYIDSRPLERSLIDRFAWELGQSPS